MRQQTVQKLQLLLQGLRSRFEQNELYFIECSIQFLSGSKATDGLFYRKDDAFAYRFLGKTEPCGFPLFLTRLTEEASKYDSLCIEYIERSGVYTIEADSKGVKSGFKEAAAKTPAVKAPQSTRDYLVTVKDAQELLFEIGIAAEDGKLKNSMLRKYNQIDYLVELIAPMLQEGKSSYTIIDCACGKSYLSFALNHYLHNVLHKKVTFIGLDIEQGVIESSRAMAKRLGYYNMEFICTDIADFGMTAAPDLVMSLHACDTATDMALAFGISSGAQQIACVPCCHKDLLNSFKLEPVKAITEHGILKARLNSVLTDGLRILKLEAEGYQVSALEFVSPLDTPKNLLIRASKTSRQNTQKEAEYEALKKTLGVFPALDRFLID